MTTNYKKTDDVGFQAMTAEEGNQSPTHHHNPLNCKRNKHLLTIPSSSTPYSHHHDDHLQLLSSILMSETSILFLLLLLLHLPPLSAQQTHSDFFFQGFHSSSNLILDGAAVVHRNGLLQLTNTTQRIIGHAFSSSPFRFKQSSSAAVSSFSTCFSFAIFPIYPGIGGHGFSFFLSPTTNLSSAFPSQYLGLFSSSNLGNLSNHILAIEFDTVRDFELQDINDNHVGLDLDSLVSNASAPSPINLTTSTPIFSWVDYDSTSLLLNVCISSSSKKPPIPLISFPVDLSPILEETMYAGLSASTGLLASSHYVLGWSFAVGSTARPLDPSSLPSLPTPKKPRVALIAGISSAAVLVGIFAVASAVYLIYKIRSAEVIEEWEFKIGPHRFTYDELKKATKGFREREIIGSGGFGRVYKGTLKKTQTEVAVKRISHESKQGLREFLSEIATIGRLRHRNLVQLQGWCRRGGDLLLVYDFMKNGSLDRYLFDDNPHVVVLSWSQRFKILKGVASGLLFLHEGWEQTVIHRDVKAGNVLLDSEMNGRLGDFGLAKLYEHGTNPGTTRVVGTLGYLAPELTRTGKPTAASDVFAFGALVLEVVCGRRPIEQKSMVEEMMMVEWVWEKWEAGEVCEVVDKRMEGRYEEEEVVAAVKVGIMCSNNRAGMRPTMREVVRYLEGERVPPEKMVEPGLDGGVKGISAAEMEDGSCTTSSFFERVNLWSSGEVEAAAAVSAITSAMEILP